MVCNQVPDTLSLLLRLEQLRLREVGWPLYFETYMRNLEFKRIGLAGDLEWNWMTGLIMCCKKFHLPLCGNQPVAFQPNSPSPIGVLNSQFLPKIKAELLHISA